MNPAASPLVFLQELETRQDDLLRQLDELDRRITAVLVEYSPSPAADDPCIASPDGEQGFRSGTRKSFDRSA
ncbi:MAG TPA: hypothetical protein VND64_06170 [Pirellulales bacterium]|nr:hypothetical protein [Pirellulales bacterium]